MKAQRTKTFLAASVTAGLLLSSASAFADTESVFIGMTPTEFSEGFNRAAQIYRLKPRMPLWPAKAGKFSATVAPGVTVSSVGVSKGDGLASIKVLCQGGDQCSEVIFAAALSADPEMEVGSLKNYLQRSMSGELQNASMTLAGLEYTLIADKAKKSITFTIVVDPDGEQ